MAILKIKKDLKWGFEDWVEAFASLIKGDINYEDINNIREVRRQCQSLF